MDQEHRQEAGRLVPVEVQEYLRSRGWQQESVTPGRVAVYRHGDYEVAVPLCIDFADYSRRNLEVLEVIADLEARSIRQVIDDLSQPPGDVLSLRIASDRVVSGTVPLIDRLRMGEATRQLLLAAAHSVLSPQAYFPRMGRTDATELLASVREAQSQRGSYVSRVIVPVEPGVEAATQTAGEEDAAAPFGRRVVRLLMGALAAVREVRALGDAKPLLTKADLGVSANLLAALAAFEPTVGRGQLDVSVSWSRTRQAPRDAITRVAFPEASLRGLGSLAESMRNHAETPDFELVGYVTRLNREAMVPDTDGKVVIVPTGDSREFDRVHVSLDSMAYHQAITAHGEGHSVRVVGTLAKSGRRWVLRQAAGFTILPATE